MIRKVSASYGFSRIFWGAMIFLDSAWWIYVNLDQYHYINTTVLMCGTGVPDNEYFYLQGFMGALGLYISVLLIENRIPIKRGISFQTATIISGVVLYLLGHS